MTQSTAVVIAAFVSALGAVLVARFAQMGPRADRELMEKEVAALVQVRGLLPRNHQAVQDLTAVVAGRAARWASVDAVYPRFQKRLRVRLWVVYGLSFAAVFFALSGGGVVALVLLALDLLTVAGTLERVLSLYFGRPLVLGSWWREFL